MSLRIRLEWMDGRIKEFDCVDNTITEGVAQFQLDGPGERYLTVPLGNLRTIGAEKK